MRTLDDSEPLAAATIAERERLADLLGQLSPDQWGSPSLCFGWQIREVVAHITMPYRHSGAKVIVGIIRARGKFDVFADRRAREDTATTSDAELLASLRANVRHPWRPPAGGQAGALSHDVIHGLDITEPLGLPPAPPERIALVLNNSTPRAMEYFGTKLDGRRFEATDTDVTLGDGPSVTELTAREILLTITGRRPMPASDA